METGNMKISDVLKVNSIRPGLERAGKTKIQVIHEMIDILAESFDLNPEQKRAVKEAILRRERQKSTGMEHGIAIPHGKTEHTKGLIAALGVYKEGIEFDTLDNKPVVCMVSDFDSSREHIQALAQVVRIFQGEDVCRDILQASSAKKVMNVLKREEKELEELHH
jgi:PTS system fructose-specific IIC component